MSSIPLQTTTFGALEELGRHFTYNLINAQGDYGSVKENIKKEMEYQSRLELNPDTHAAIRDLPRASEIVLHARQALVSRLDDYAREHSDALARMVSLLSAKFYPEIEKYAQRVRATPLSCVHYTGFARFWYCCVLSLAAWIV